MEGEDFNVVVHDQYNALFTGLEMSGQYITRFNDFDFLTNFVGEFLKGYRNSNDKAISRIPQSKVNVGLQLKNEDWDTNLKY